MSGLSTVAMKRTPEGALKYGHPSHITGVSTASSQGDSFKGCSVFDRVRPNCSGDTSDIPSQVMDMDPPPPPRVGPDLPVA